MHGIELDLNAAQLAIMHRYAVWQEVTADL